uniref:Uncharacterized protein n=1 Tax=Setaria italica TaxID=4555 RepID=K3XSS2_SETIT
MGRAWTGPMDRLPHGRSKQTGNEKALPTEQRHQAGFSPNCSVPALVGPARQPNSREFLFVLSKGPGLDHVARAVSHTTPP